MRLRPFLRSGWIRVPQSVVGLLVLAGGNCLLYRLSTTTPAMYASPGALRGNAPGVQP